MMRPGVLLFVLAVAAAPALAAGPDLAALTRQAEAGDAAAAFALGRAYQMGEGAPHDDQRALHWFRRAAQAGHPEAPVVVGFSYEFGVGAAPDSGEAYFWYGVGARRGDAVAAARQAQLAPRLDPETRSGTDHRIAAYFDGSVGAPPAAAPAIDTVPIDTSPVSAPRAGSPPAPAPAQAEAAAEPEVRIQLGAFSNPEGVLDLWQRLVDAQGDLLAGLGPRIDEHMRPDGEILHRLQAGPVADRAAAEALCAALAERDVDCLVVAP